MITQPGPGSYGANNFTKAMTTTVGRSGVVYLCVNKATRLSTDACWHSAASFGTASPAFNALPQILRETGDKNSTDPYHLAFHVDHKTDLDFFPWLLAHPDQLEAFNQVIYSFLFVLTFNSLHRVAYLLVKITGQTWIISWSDILSGPGNKHCMKAHQSGSMASISAKSFWVESIQNIPHLCLLMLRAPWAPMCHLQTEISRAQRRGHPSGPASAHQLSPRESSARVSWYRSYVAWLLHTPTHQRCVLQCTFS